MNTDLVPDSSPATKPDSGPDAAPDSGPDAAPDSGPATRPDARRRAVRAGLLAASPVLLLASPVLLLVVVVLYAAAHVLAGDTIPEGTSVAGIGVGGLDHAAAQARLEQALAPRTKAAISVQVGGERAEVDPVAAGLALDVRKTAEEAGAGLAPVRLVRSLTGGRRVEPVLRIDEARLSATVSHLAETFDRPARDARVEFSGPRPILFPSGDGRAIDQATSAAVLRSAYLVTTTPQELPARTVRPRVHINEATRTILHLAHPAVAAPVTLSVAGRTITVDPALIASSLTFTPTPAGRLEPTIDGAKLRVALERHLEDAETPAKDASFQIVNDRPQVVPAVQGKQVSPHALADAVRAALTRPGPRTAKVGLSTVDPKLTTDKAQGLGISEVVSTFTTRYPYAAYRLQNIHRAADLIRGNLVLPGETWSLNNRVGERTAANGFAVGVIIRNGKFDKDYGGGVSQVATTTFNAAFFAGLEDVEHRAHSFFINRYPAGREATVAWPVLDLRFRNNTSHGIYIDTSYTNNSVTVTLYGTKMYDIESVSSSPYNVRPFTVQYDPSGSCVPQEGVRGFDIDVHRVFKKGGVEVKREKLHTSYDAADNILCRPPPAPASQPATPPPVPPD